MADRRGLKEGGFTRIKSGKELEEGEREISTIKRNMAYTPKSSRTTLRFPHYAIMNKKRP
jgi:hypothetical protein